MFLDAPLPRIVKPFDASGAKIKSKSNGPFLS